MKIFERLFMLVILILITSCYSVNCQSLKLAGLWRSNNDVLLKVSDSGSGFIARYVLTDDCAAGHHCPINGGGPYYVKGTKNGNTLTLEMLRCTHKKAMRDEGMAEHWTTPCKVTTVTNNNIEGTWRTNWYWWDTDNTGREHNFRRDEKEDKDSPFSMNRSSCRDELSRVVAEIDQKAQILKELEGAIHDEDQRFDDAKQNWKNEIDEQLEEDVYQTFVPVGIKVSPGSGQDWGSYIESWVDFAKELGEASKNWGLQKAGMIISLWDLLIDWGNVNAKGFTTLEEMETINHSLSNMRDHKVNLFSSWITSWMEYESLKSLCASEIPLNQQPKPNVEPLKDEKLIQKATESASVQKELGSEIRTAKNTTNDINKLFKKMQSVLGTYKNADSTKSINHVMQAAEIKNTEAQLYNLSLLLNQLFTSMKNIQKNFSTLKNQPRII